MADAPHPAAQTIIEKADANLFPSAHALTPAGARDRLHDLFASQPVEDVANTIEFSIQGPDSELPVRIYEPDADGPYPVLVYFHGGGFVAGGLDTHDNVCAALTNRADCLTIAVDYRLAPEHPFPAAVEDCYATLEWAADHAADLGADPDRLAVAGDSAGGNLAAVASLLTRDRDGPDIDHQALIYPAVASPLVHDIDSWEENAEGYLLELETSQWYVDNYVDNELDMRNAYLAPLLADDLSGLPPATIVTAGFDIHRDEGLAYADRLEAAGVDVDRCHYEGMIHTFVSLYELVDQGEDALEEIAANLRAAY